MAAKDSLNKVLFHGSPHLFEPGDEVTSSKSRGVEIHPERLAAMGDDSMYTYATFSRSTAQRFADGKGTKLGGFPSVFEVSTDDPDLEFSGVDFGYRPGMVRSLKPLKVVRNTSDKEPTQGVLALGDSRY